MDVHFTLPRPIPIKNLFAKIGDVGKMELVVWLFHTWSFLWAWMEGRIKNLGPPGAAVSVVLVVSF